MTDKLTNVNAVKAPKLIKEITVSRFIKPAVKATTPTIKILYDGVRLLGLI
ncbi:hypothetical protein D3C75_1292610 [compost metagenome]